MVHPSRINNVSVDRCILPLALILPSKRLIACSRSLSVRNLLDSVDFESPLSPAEGSKGCSGSPTTIQIFNQSVVRDGPTFTVRQLYRHNNDRRKERVFQGFLGDNQRKSVGVQLSSGTKPRLYRVVGIRRPTRFSPA